jgi:LacI family transcriptional regulator
MTKADVGTAKSLGLPVVNVGGVLQNTGLPSVNADQHAMGRAAAEHLLECGFRRFAFYGLKNTWYSEQRRDAFIERVGEAGGKCSVLDVPNSVSRRQPWHIWVARLERWLKTLKPPVGMLAVHDPRASLVVNACQNIGLRVPDDIGIIGIENHEIVCEFAQVRLSSVPTNNRQIGFEAAAMLDRLMIGEPAPSETLLVPPREVVRRDSTDIIAVEDTHVADAARYIHVHLSDDFTIDNLKKVTGISRRGFERRFKECLGCTPLQYISRARVGRAKVLLLDPEQLPMKQIARACGFSGTQHFRLVFQRLTGMAPAEYRQANMSKRIKRHD